MDQGVIELARQIARRRAEKTGEMHEALLKGDFHHALECAGNLCGWSDEDIAARLATLPEVYEVEWLREQVRALAETLSQIMSSLPQKRDWLDPAVERRALDVLAGGKREGK